MPRAPTRRAVLTALGLGAVGSAALAACGIRLEDDAPRVPLIPTREPVPGEASCSGCGGTGDLAEQAAALGGAATALPARLAALHQEQAEVLRGLLRARGARRVVAEAQRRHQARAAAATTTAATGTTTGSRPPTVRHPPPARDQPSRAGQPRWPPTGATPPPWARPRRRPLGRPRRRAGRSAATPSSPCCRPRPARRRGHPAGRAAPGRPHEPGRPALAARPREHPRRRLRLRGRGRPVAGRPAHPRPPPWRPCAPGPDQEALAGASARRRLGYPLPFPVTARRGPQAGGAGADGLRARQAAAVAQAAGDVAPSAPRPVAGRHRGAGPAGGWRPSPSPACGDLDGRGRRARPGGLAGVGVAAAGRRAGRPAPTGPPAAPAARRGARRLGPQAAGGGRPAGRPSSCRSAATARPGAQGRLAPHRGRDEPLALRHWDGAARSGWSPPTPGAAPCCWRPSTPPATSSARSTSTPPARPSAGCSPGCTSRRRRGCARCPTCRPDQVGRLQAAHDRLPRRMVERAAQLAATSPPTRPATPRWCTPTCTTGTSWPDAASRGWPSTPSPWPGTRASRSSRCCATASTSSAPGRRFRYLVRRRLEIVCEAAGIDEDAARAWTIHIAVIEASWASRTATATTCRLTSPWPRPSTASRREPSR